MKKDNKLLVSLKRKCRYYPHSESEVHQDAYEGNAIMRDADRKPFPHQMDSH